MRKFISTISLICTISLGNIVGQQISIEGYKKELIHEEFNQIGNVFKIETTTNNYFILDNGDYLLSRNNNESDYSIIAKNSLVSDFVLKTSIKISPSKNKKASVGIILKAQENSERAIVFEINRKGQYRIRHLLEDPDFEITDLKGKKINTTWVKSKIINKEDKYNAVEIRTENNNFDLYVNNNYLTSFSFSGYTTGSCGLTISPSTKARISYYYVNSKGEKNIVNSYSSNMHSSYQQSTTHENIIQELNKKIKTLKEDNKGLNKKIEILKENNKDLNKLNIEEKYKKEEEIQILNSTVHELNISFDNKTDQLNTEINSLKKELSTSQVTNTKLTKELNISNSNKTSISTKLNKEISGLQTKINSLEKEKSTLSSKLSLEINSHKKTHNKLSKDLTRKTKEIKKLELQLTIIENDLSALRKIQSEYNTVTSNLESHNTSLYIKIDSLNSELTILKQKLTDLKVTNTDLKNLFVLRDFEANKIKTSNVITKKSASLPNKQFTKEKNDIYSVQFGVYMTIQPYKNLSTLDSIWYEITKQGTYVYLSGKFNYPEEATRHKNILVSLGYPNAFVVTLNK